ncbi:MAG: hypothetical protein Q8Q38_01675 [bacterium]|nr:hypothetical protein [bacterium]MDZ4232001.1 hypothetical protein [Candidatus Pacearchaeota archaeon]
MTKLLPLILMSFALVGLGAFVGYGFEKGAVKSAVDQKVNEIVQGYNIVPRSRLFVSWTNNANGIVSEVTSTSITVERDNEKLTVPVTENTVVERRGVDEQGALTGSSEPMSFLDLKGGENVILVVLANDKGDLTADRIFVLPSVTNLPPPSQN